MEILRHFPAQCLALGNPNGTHWLVWNYRKPCRI